jgi:hypothetical protein
VGLPRKHGATGEQGEVSARDEAVHSTPRRGDAVRESVWRKRLADPTKSFSLSSSISSMEIS